ncbi:hypothetical protein JZU46_00605 [bacterium]|nr:hypothetical protein [bacterium]
MKIKSRNLLHQTMSQSMASIVDEIQGCRASILWTHRALGTGLELLAMSDADLSEAMGNDDRFAMICQIFKMLSLDQKYAETQANLRNRVVNRITLALVARQHPDTECLLKSEIDFTLLPDAPGMSSVTVNAVRPSQASVH